jgi:hypothetical protein
MRSYMRYAFMPCSLLTFTLTNGSPFAARWQLKYSTIGLGLLLGPDRVGRDAEYESSDQYHCACRIVIIGNAVC